jgi:hypothetical protein
MVDLILANKLVKAVPSGAHLLLVGMWTSFPQLAPVRCCGTCWPPPR